MKTPLALRLNLFCAWILVACSHPHNALAQPPPNDTCTGAIALTEGLTNTMSTTNATTTGEEQACRYGFTKGVLFTYTPSFNGLVLVRTCGSSFPTLLEVFNGNCGTLSWNNPVAC